MPNRIAVIGSDSFLAKHIVKSYSEGEIVTGFSRSNSANITDHQYFNYPDSKFEPNNLTDFDCVIYCAGAGIQAGQGTKEIYQVNTFLPIELALSLNKNQFGGKLITFGSYFEIGNNSVEQAFTEDHVKESVLSVPNDYCRSKRLLTKFFSDSNLTYSHYHLILPTIHGYGEDERRLIPYLIGSLKEDKIPNLTSGIQTRQYLHVSDAAGLVKEISYSDELGNGIYNMPCFETIQIKDVVRNIYNGLKLDMPVLEKPKSRFDETMKYLALDSGKLSKMFPSWVPQISIETSIKDYLQ